MSWSLPDARGRRKYLTAPERAAFIRTAFETNGPKGTFCATLALTGARISEVLAVTPERIDIQSRMIVFETLKRRRKGVFRAVLVPAELILTLCRVHSLERDTPQTARLWAVNRPTAWKYVKAMMLLSKAPAALAKARALRHAFGVEAVQQRVALSVIRKWLGHAKIETTAIYAEPIGDEERALPV